MVALPPRGGVASLWGCGLLGITSCSSSLTPYCWDHFISIFIQLTNTLEQLLCVKDCSRYERYGRHQDLKVIPFTDLTLEGEKLGFHPPPPPRCPLTRARLCRTQPAPVFIPLMILIIPQGSRLLAFSLSLPEVRKKEKHTANIIFFPKWTHQPIPSLLCCSTGYLPSQSEAPASGSLHLLRASSGRVFSLFSCMRDFALNTSSGLHLYSHQEFRKCGIPSNIYLIEIPHRAILPIDSSQLNFLGTFPLTVCVSWSSFIKFKFRFYLSLVDVLLWTSSSIGERGW